MMFLKANNQTKTKEYKILQTFLEKHYEVDSPQYKGIKQIISYCNIIALSIHKILYRIEIDKALNDGNYDDNNPIKINEPTNWLYAIIDKTLFEATIKTGKNKREIKEDTKDIIDGILYLQDNEVYIKILKKDEIQNINKDSPLSNLFAIHEAIFFISVDKNGNPLINNNEVANNLIGYITPRTQIFCTDLKENSKDTIIKCYINETLKYYPESTR